MSPAIFSHFMNKLLDTLQGYKNTREREREREGFCDERDSNISLANIWQSHFVNIVKSI